MRFPLLVCLNAFKDLRFASRLRRHSRNCYANARLVAVAVALLGLSACNDDAPQVGPVKPHEVFGTSESHKSVTGPGMLLATSPQSYLEQAQRVRQALDRPWAPAEGRLGNLRHVQITARDCVVRVVTGTENRVFPGTSDVVVVEGSRVLDADPNEQPAPRDVVLAPDRVQACPGPGTCGVSITSVIAAALPAPEDAANAARSGAAGAVCFTLQLASGHDMLVGGDGLNLLIDRLHQPALRLTINPSANQNVWLEEVALGLLSISANAAVRVGGSGTVDFLTAGSSNSASVMYLHPIRAHQVGVSSTTTGSRWSIRIDPDTKAGYYQPARAPGKIAELYSIEIDGPLERLEVPAGSVFPSALTQATRTAASALRQEVLDRAGPAPLLPASDPELRSATALASALPRDARQRVADVAKRYLPSTIQITEVALWNQGGRIEGTAPDAATAAKVVPQLESAGEFTFVSGGKGLPRDGVYVFSIQVGSSCTSPGTPSTCPAGDPATPGAYSERQVRAALEPLLGPTIIVHDVFLDHAQISLEAQAPSESEARAALDRIQSGMFRQSSSSYGQTSDGKAANIVATLALICAVPPRPDGVCAPQL